MSGSTRLSHGEDGVSGGESDARLKAQKGDHSGLRNRGFLRAALRGISCGLFKRFRRWGKKAASPTASGER